MIIKMKKPPTRDSKVVKKVRSIISKVVRKPNERLVALVSTRTTEVVSMWDDGASCVSLRSKSGHLYLRNSRDWVTHEGVGAGEYSAHIWAIVDALKMHKFITAKEAIDFSDWLREETRQYDRRSRERQLREDANRLGFDLVPNKKLVEDGREDDT